MAKMGLENEDEEKANIETIFLECYIEMLSDDDKKKTLPQVGSHLYVCFSFFFYLKHRTQCRHYLLDYLLNF
jgi:hypothetical protein